MPYDKDLLRAVGMGIPCMHMPALPMALKAIKEFKQYIDGAIETEKTLSDLSADLERMINEREQ
jgi:hypothetical protein